MPRHGEWFPQNPIDTLTIPHNRLSQPEVDFAFYYIRQKENPELADVLAQKRKAIGKARAEQLEIMIDRVIRGEVNALTTLRMPLEMIATNVQIMPPDEPQKLPEAGEGEMENRDELIPRSRYIVEVLTDLNLDYSIGYQGPDVETGDTFREQPYSVYIIPDRGKLIEICDEINNATYVISTSDTSQWEQYAGMKKSELMALGKDTVVHVRWMGDATTWKQRLRSLLEIKNRPEAAPPGWLTIFELAKLLHEKLAMEKIFNVGGVDLFIRHIVDTYDDPSLPNKEEHYREYLNKQNRTTRHLSPSLQTALENKLRAHKEELLKYEIIPEGWVSVGQLATKFCAKHSLSGDEENMAYRRLYAWFEQVKNDFTEDVDYKKLKPKYMRFHETLFLSPAIQERLLKETTDAILENAAMELAPEDWHNASSFAVNLIKKHQSRLTLPALQIRIDKILKKLLPSLTEKDYKMYKARANNFPAFHFSKSIQDTIEEELRPIILEFDSTPEAPDDWYNEFSLANELVKIFPGKKIGYFRDRVRQYREEVEGKFSSELIGKRKNKKSLITIHFAPEVAEYIREKVKSVLTR